MEWTKIRFYVEYSKDGFLWYQIKREFFDQRDAKKYVYAGKDWQEGTKVRIIMKETIINESVLCDCFK